MTLDEDEDVEDSEYENIVDVFETVRTSVLNHEITRLIKFYVLLLKTKNYYSTVLEDLDLKKDEIPEANIDDIVSSVIAEIKNYNNSEDVELSFNLLDFWINKNNGISESNKEKLKDQIINLYNNDKSELLRWSLKYYDKFQGIFNSVQLSEIHEVYIASISIDIMEHLNLLFDAISDNASLLSNEGQQLIINKIIEELHIIENIKNSDYYNLLKELFIKIESSLDDSVLYELIKPLNAQNILHINFPEATLGDRNNYCSLITLIFSRLEENKQNEYIQTFIEFLDSGEEENIEYGISQIYAIYTSIKNEEIIYNYITSFLSVFELELKPSIKMRTLEIILSVKDKLADEEIEETTSEIIELCDFEAEFCFNFLINNWILFNQNDKKYNLISKLVDKGIFNIKPNQKKVLSFLCDDIDKLDNDGIRTSLDELSHLLKDSSDKRTFFAEILELIKSQIDEDIRTEIKKQKVKQIEKEKDINLSRNWFTFINKFKGQDYEKDKSISELFSRLLNSSQAKKKLAIDNFEYYYDYRIPYGRKGELTERLNALLCELNDSYYRKKIHDLGKKYNLKLKRRFLEVMRDFID